MFLSNLNTLRSPRVVIYRICLRIKWTRKNCRRRLNWHRCLNQCRLLNRIRRPYWTRRWPSNTLPACWLCSSSRDACDYKMWQQNLSNWAWRNNIEHYEGVYVTLVWPFAGIVHYTCSLDASSLKRDQFGWVDYKSLGCSEEDRRVAVSSALPSRCSDTYAYCPWPRDRQTMAPVKPSHCRTDSTVLSIGAAYILSRRYSLNALNGRRCCVISLRNRCSRPQVQILKCETWSCYQKQE